MLVRAPSLNTESLHLLARAQVPRACAGLATQQRRPAAQVAQHGGHGALREAPQINLESGFSGDQQMLRSDRVREEVCAMSVHHTVARNADSVAWRLLPSGRRPWEDRECL